MVVVVVVVVVLVAVVVVMGSDMVYAGSGRHGVPLVMMVLRKKKLHLGGLE